ncbi:MAG: glycoside hydrolase TIM-barrel-like domain-containing protein [Paracoccaceae bacterium]|nr:glycoside hydrolase TIM-barrel-like domain-containing protein [Paracoccaceae bacterium]
MATILLSAVGAAVGAGFGGTVLGLSGAVIGRAVGATLGRVIDQRLLGSGSDAVEIGRMDRFRLMGASEGGAVAQVYGRTRIAGQVIWATRFQETTATSGGGGKGAPSQPRTTEFSYSVSLAVALCEGQITNVGRIWADGAEVTVQSINLRVYKGGENQLPDPKIEAVEGAGMAPAYRGIAYVVIEDLQLAPFGNRVPQFSFEVVRAAQGDFADEVIDQQRAVKAVALIPGTGEYSLAITAVHYSEEPGANRSANINSPSGKTDFNTAMRQLGDEMPNCGAVSLVVSWFGSDLRCGECVVQPKVEQRDLDGVGMPWRVADIARSSALEIAKLDERSIYGGTPADRAVIEAIQAIRAGGKEVMFYPFILMEQLAGNGLPDPWSDAADQAILPWRGRITLSKAPGRSGSPDRTAAAVAEVADFFGSAQSGDFSISGGEVQYSGPNEWRYRRFILHYAHLCALAGGVDAFCIGSEMVGLTQIRGAAHSFPAVVALRQLTAEVRAILGPTVRLSYAADWSEYFGYHVGRNVYFHLDPLWADPNIDFIGIDNYMPLSDWRNGNDHADAERGSIYNLDYLKGNIAGGEGFDWFYDSIEGELSQRRKPIEDGAYGEPWIFRFKDLKSWWSKQHHNRINGERSAEPTDWQPQSKPIWFTEYGCAAIDKGTNQPNKFLDPKSSESVLPKFSNGRRDDLMQMQYLRAMADFWGEDANNPVSAVFAGQMVDMAHAHVWTWDARPFPHFPNNLEIWGDGENYARGHWLTGRAANQALASVVAEICERSGVQEFDVSRLFGVVRGYWLAEVGPARAALQPLMLAYGFDAAERGGVLTFRMRDGRRAATLDVARLAVSSDLDGRWETMRAPEAETAGKVRLGYIEAEGNYDVRQSEAIFPDEVSFGVSQTELPLVLTAVEGRGIVERWLAESRVARDTARFALPRSAMQLGAGDVISLEGADYRIDRVEQTEAQLIDAVRVEPAVYQPSDASDERVIPRAFVAPVPTFPVFLDLPLLTGQEVPHAPHLAVTARPWPGAVAVWDAVEDDGYEFNRLFAAASVIGRTQSELSAGRSGLWDRGEPLRVRIFGGTLSSASELAVLNGANVMAIGDGSSDRWEIFQFATAALVAPRTYDLALRLRGQLSSDAIMPPNWPIGSRIVLLNKSVQQIRLPASSRGLARHYRIGVGARGFDDPAVVHRVEAFQGIGLRPYAPVHLNAVTMVSGDLVLRWIRRTRVDGDSWQSAEVPLGEDKESYLVRVVLNGTIRREVEVFTPAWTYAAAMQALDGVTEDYLIEVAQMSDRFGPGLFKSIIIPSRDVAP